MDRPFHRRACLGPARTFWDPLRRLFVSDDAEARRPRPAEALADTRIAAGGAELVRRVRELVRVLRDAASEQEAMADVATPHWSAGKLCAERGRAAAYRHAARLVRDLLDTNQG